MIASCETETKVFSYDDWPACYQERYSLLSHILWGILLNESRQVYVAIVSELAGYFDDGGHPDDQVAVLVAGFVASKEQWLAFDVELAEVLASYGISSAFHRTDFEKGIGPFNLKPKRKRVLLETLLGVIRRHTLSSFSESVLMNDYRKLNDSHLFEEFIGTPYALVGRSLAAKLNRWKTKYAPDSRLLLFFEDGTKHKGDFMEAMQRDGLPCPVFLKKMEATPLQASDTSLTSNLE